MSDQETGTDSAAETTEEQQAQPQAQQQAHQQASSEDGNTGEAETEPGSKKGRGRKQSTARKTRSGVIGCSDSFASNGLSASLIAFMSAAGAPPVPASPAPLAPNNEVRLGVSICSTTMSGISAAIGTR